jgi:hypothetical protein
MKNTWAAFYLDFYRNIHIPQPADAKVKILTPFRNQEVYSIMDHFYHKYYNDCRPRIMLVGINPGRFGAGITGVPFTDPIRLKKDCGIDHTFEQKPELSSVFMYELINAMGGPDAFYRKLIFTSTSTVGYVKSGKNYNYYDDELLKSSQEPLIQSFLSKQIQLAGVKQIAFSIGKGKNYQYLNRLNKSKKWWITLDHLPHPRWVLQYQSATKDHWLQHIKDKLNRALNEVGQV